MTDDLCLDTDAMARHAERLDGISSAVRAVGAAATLRVGDGDYGAAFGWFASIVNDMLAGTEQSITRHSADLEKNVTALRATIASYQQTDSSGASAVTETGTP